MFFKMNWEAFRRFLFFQMTTGLTVGLMLSCNNVIPSKILYIKDQKHTIDTVSIVDPETYNQMMVIVKSTIEYTDLSETYRDTLDDGTVQTFGKLNGKTIQLSEYIVEPYK